MIGKCLICFVMCVVLVTCYVKVGREVPYSEQELPCLSKGGTCVQAGDCPLGNLEKMQGLCPSGPNQPSECCYGLPLSATSCRAQGGQCFVRSYSCAIRNRADDCAENEHCCILVN
ncbi:U-scoloptoxin(19)-Tl1a-like [Maniola jurtina]|uniref:U-scoloptoxin(19)-Tl1a-like n=1 Tax=Maniola jurtina TaxID=191418 RepID=UPI001E6885AE|nr:U-scoloptoxin(19)-Tl1a-like [Maniola jurtina]